MLFLTVLSGCPKYETPAEEETGKLRIIAGILSGYSDLSYAAVITSRTKAEQTANWEGSRINTVDLPAGMWNIALSAMDGDEVIAAGNVKNVEVTEGETKSVSVDLILFSGGGDPEPVTEEGTLLITVTNSGSFSGASFAVTISNDSEAFDKFLGADGSGVFSLTAGLWDIALSVISGGNEAANDAKTGVLVEKDKQTDVLLTPVIPSGTGTFSWTVNYPSGQSAAKITKAEMRLADSEAAAVTGYAPRNLPTSGTPGAPSDTVTLDSGSYKVDLNIEMQWGSSSQRSITRRSETIVILEDQTTSKTFTFDYKDFILLLEAEASSGGAYSVITAKGFDYESPDQTNGGHENFGAHISQKFDAALDKNVFEFIMHRNEDRNATGDWTRQRVEIKLDHRNGSNGRDYCALDSDEGRSFIYRWKFKLPADFAVSTDFTHIHQIKNEGGDSSQPIVALTARNASGNTRLQLSYYAPGSSSPTQFVNDNSHLLTPYLGQWVQCEESITYSSDPAEAAYSIKITRIDNSQVLMNYAAPANTIQTWRAGNTHGRPKFGLYRLIFKGSNPGNYQEPSAANAIAGLKDEAILYADFEVVRLK
jgi:hypothetical protein